MSELTDAALVQGALGDAEEAFAHLYRRFHPRLVRLIVRRTGDRALAEDVAQEALLRALDKLDTFDRSRPLWPWLKVIASNLAVDAGRKRSREVEWDPGDTEGVTAVEMPACEDGMVLAQVLSNLPDRQRVAVSLRYLQDWESSEAASFLGLSIPAFEQLLFRARKRLRLEYSRLARGAFGVFGPPGRWLRREMARLAGRLPGARRTLETTAQVGPATWAQAAAGGLTLLAALPSLPVSAPAERPPVAAAVRDGGAHGGRGAGRDHAAGGNVSRGEGGSRTVEAALTPAAPAPEEATENDRPNPKDVTDPTHRVRDPEDATIVSVAFAPESPSGKRAFAIGDAHCALGTCKVLFTSGDGGTSWRRLPARGLSGHTLIVPPGSDGSRLFAMAPTGLQVSSDGGRSFRMVGPTGVPLLTGSVAVSPAFDRGDPIMLIGAQTLLRYDDAAATITPEPSTTLNGPFEPVFSPSYPADPRFLVGGMRVEDGVLKATVFNCRTRAGCSWMNVRGGNAVPKIRPRPDYASSDVAFAFTPNGLYRSDDVWGFSRIETPWPRDVRLRDLALLGAGKTMFAAVHAVEPGEEEGLYRSDDGGLTWSEVSSPVFADGAATIAVSGSRLLVSLPGNGLACSSDRGEHWSRRC